MMVSRRTRRDFTFTMNQDSIRVVTDLPSADEAWRVTDAQGHEHHWAQGWPTLVFVVDRSYWCDGRIGLFVHDPHDVEEGHYECPECGERIEPGMHPPGRVSYLPGLTTATLTGRPARALHQEITFYLSPDEITQLREIEDTANREAYLLRLLDTVPDYRIAEWRIEHDEPTS